jgi:VanZ family protein
MAPSPQPLRREAWIFTAATLGYACVLFWATHAPDVRPPAIGPPGVPSDKVFHFLGYAVLGVLAIAAVIAWRARRGAILIAILVLFVVAGIDEVTQPLTSRDVELADWCADAAGVIVGAIVGQRLFWILRPSA